jgi:hypothetical protein
MRLETTADAAARANAAGSREKLSVRDTFFIKHRKSFKPEPPDLAVR